MIRASVLVVLFLLSCGGMPVVPPDGGDLEDLDAGGDALDAGAGADAGAVDAGNDAGADALDAGADGGAVDAGDDAGSESMDAGGLFDAGMNMDGGADAGRADAGGLVVYPFGRLHSPVTPELAARWRGIAARAVHDDDALMKVGDSLTVSPSHLACFAGNNVDLAGRVALQPTIDAIKGVRIGTTTPFDRVSLAATIGWSAQSAVAGMPSPVERELTATNARFATVMFGTNDVGFMNPDLYGRSMFTLVDGLLARGVVPILSSVPPRQDSVTANAQVPIYNAVNRALAQARQIPYVDLHLALQPLPNFGITTADNVHLNVFTASGAGRGCLLTTPALRYGHNVRNLVTLEALTRTRNATLSGVAADATAVIRAGAGTSADPLVIGSLPYVDVRDTRSTGTRGIATYSCSPANEGGPEVIYRLEVSRSMTVRATVVSLGSADLDVHLLRASVASANCLARNDKTVTMALMPGTYFFSIDTYVASGTELAGEYALVVLEQ